MNSIIKVFDKNSCYFIPFSTDLEPISLATKLCDILEENNTLYWDSYDIVDSILNIYTSPFPIGNRIIPPDCYLYTIDCDTKIFAWYYTEQGGACLDDVLISPRTKLLFEYVPSQSQIDVFESRINQFEDLLRCLEDWKRWLENWKVDLGNSENK